MLFFIHGTDSDKARARAKAVVGIMQTKRPGAEYFRVTPDTWSAADFEQFAGGQGLFERKFIVFADGIFENVEAKEWVSGNLKELKESENGFIFLERKVDAESLKKIEKVAQESKKFDAAEKTYVSRPGFNTSFNIFTLADALGSRNKVRFWSLLSEAFMQGISPEEINGVLFWQTKAMLAAASAPSAALSGLKPFVYTKSRRYADAYGREALVSLSRKLIAMYHDAHRGIHDFATSLERLALSI